MKPQQQIGVFIKNTRERKGITQKDFAKALKDYEKVYRKKNHHQYIKEVLIGHGTYIDSIQTSTSNFRNKKHGGSGGTLYRWSVPPGHCITTIWVRSGAYVDSLQFKTDKGAVSPKFGGDGGNFYEVNLQGCLKGIYGRSGAYVDQIGFYY